MKEKIEEILRTHSVVSNIQGVQFIGLCTRVGAYKDVKKPYDEEIIELTNKLYDTLQQEIEKTIKDLEEDILRMSVETADLSFRDGFFKARYIILHNIQEYLDSNKYNNDLDKENIIRRNKMNKEKIGKKYYSPYFKQMIEVVEYVDDNNWSFKLENGEVYAAKTPLSYFEEQSEK